MRRRLVIVSMFGACMALVSCFASLDGFSSGQATLDSGGAPGADGSTTADNDASSANLPRDGGYVADADATVSSAPSCGGRPGVGAPMARVLDAGFCIDTTEVTYDQYAQFYAAKPPFPSMCQFKTSYTGPAFTGNAAIGNVDWCDAYAYCQWAGKRLCGGMNGVQLDLSNSLTPMSEWQYTCTHGGDSNWPYPYGEHPDPTICLYHDSLNSSHSRAVASNPQCVGPAGIFDLSGNVWEWEDACDRSPGDSAGKDCNLRGGGFLRDSADWGACAAVPGGWDRESYTDDTGIRCCSDFK